MQGFNYTAGGDFPPRMPEGFSEEKFGHPDVVIFVAQARADLHADAQSLAGRLDTGPKPRGLVFSYSPENRDFRSCLDFFRIAAIPSYAVVKYKEFQELLCVDTAPGGQANRDLSYALINGDLIARAPAADVVKEVLKVADFFFSDDRRPEADLTAYSTHTLSAERLARLRGASQPDRDVDTITVLFQYPAARHTRMESILYDAFLRYGGATGDVLVRVLYPSYISDEYAVQREAYGVTKLPAAIFSSRRKTVAVKVERDFFEGVAHLEGIVRHVISDLHRAVASERAGTERGLQRELRGLARSQPFSLERSGSVGEEPVFALRPVEVLAMPLRPGTGDGDLPRWLNDGEHNAEIARYVRENDDFVNQVVKSAEKQLRKLTRLRHVSFASAVFEGKPDTLKAALKALYSELEGRELTYSFEREFNAATGGQFIRIPSLVGQERRGTCVDLVVLFLSCVANIKLRPVYLHLETHDEVDHALAGVWFEAPPEDLDAEISPQHAINFVSKGSVFVLDCTGFTEGYPARQYMLTFEEANKKARAWLKHAAPRFVVDVLRALEVDPNHP